MKVCTDEQGGLEEYPGGEVAIRFIEGQIARWGSLSSIAHLQQVQVIVTEEVGSFGMERCCVDGSGKQSPGWPNVASVAPRLSDSPAPDKGLVPSPLAKGILESDVGASCELGDGV